MSDRGSLGLAEAARETGLASSTALRLLRTLESSGFLSRDSDSAYRAGPRLIQVGAKAFSRESLVTLSFAPMQTVVEQTGESVYLSVPGDHQSVLYISIVEGTHSVRHTNWVGRTIPSSGSAAGAVLRGEAPEAGFLVLENTVEPDVTAISAPITVSGRTVAAMSTLVPTYRLDHAKQQLCGESLVRAAQSLEETLGETPGPAEMSADS